MMIDQLNLFYKLNKKSKEREDDELAYSLN
jgi:hypothetical protein